MDPTASPRRSGGFARPPLPGHLMPWDGSRVQASARIHRCVVHPDPARDRAVVAV